MNTIYFTCDNGETKSLLAKLKGSVFHRTSATAFEKIRSTGKVLANKDGGRFPSNISSEKSFGQEKGYVCLLDLRDGEKLDAALESYPFLGPDLLHGASHDWEVFEVAYLILHHEYYNRIVENSAAVKYHRENPHRKYIPKAEVWIEDQVPLDWIDIVLLVTFRRKCVFDPITEAVSNLYKRKTLE